MLDWESVVGLAAVAIAVAAWRSSVAAIRATYRPVLRPVHLIVRATGHVHPTDFIVKNIGVGPAIGIQVFNYPGLTDAAAVGTLDVLEPLAPDGSIEQARVGRGMISLSSEASFDPPPGTTYRILYQDLAGNWHETHATYGPNGILATYLGQYHWWHYLWSPNRRIPKAAADAAHVVRPYES